MYIFLFLSINYQLLYSLSPTPPQTSITSQLVESCESLKINSSNDEISSLKITQSSLCNSSNSRNSSSPLIDSSSPTNTPSTLDTTLIEEVKKLALHSSDPEISKFKTNSPLASSSSNLIEQQQISNTKSDAEHHQQLQHMRLSHYNNNNNSNNNENNNLRKWHCLVS